MGEKVMHCKAATVKQLLDNLESILRDVRFDLDQVTGQLIQIDAKMKSLEHTLAVVKAKEVNR